MYFNSKLSDIFATIIMILQNYRALNLSYTDLIINNLIIISLLLLLILN